MIVADANLIVTYLLGGPNTPAAEQVHARDSTWAAPPLWRCEIRNAFAGEMRRGSLTMSAAWQLHEAAEVLLANHEFSPPGERVLQLVADSRCSAYDCEYVAIAEDLGVPLVTFDRQLQREFPRIATSPAAFLRPKR